MVKVLITTPLEPHLVERIAAVNERLDVVYRPDLIAKPRFPGDHTAPPSRNAAQEAEWSGLLAEAEVLFDFEVESASDILKLAPKARWIQSTSSGIGPLVQKMGLLDSDVLVTKAAGVHATPLSEYAVFAMLYFARSMPHVIANQKAHVWEWMAIQTLAGKTLGIIGLGAIGREVARKAQFFGMRVLGVERPTERAKPEDFGVDALYVREQLPEFLPQLDYLVLCVPLLPETTRMIGEVELGAMKRGAVLVNIARGPVVVEPAVIDALQSGQLSGAALDVFTVEPLPAESPIWDMPNVLVTPHSMSTAIEENDLEVDLFCDNLRRYLDGRPLRNLFDKSRGF